MVKRQKVRHTQFYMDNKSMQCIVKVLRTGCNVADNVWQGSKTFVMLLWCVKTL